MESGEEDFYDVTKLATIHKKIYPNLAIDQMKIILKSNPFILWLPARTCCGNLNCFLNLEM
jgi:Ni,Fe-hydrogenase I small subunit